MGTRKSGAMLRLFTMSNHNQGFHSLAYHGLATLAGPPLMVIPWSFNVGSKTLVAAFAPCLAVSSWAVRHRWHVGPAAPKPKDESYQRVVQHYRVPSNPAGAPAGSASSLHPLWILYEFICTRMLNTRSLEESSDPSRRRDLVHCSSTS